MVPETSLMPPTEKRKNSRSSARAIDWPMLVLPTPGGPTKHRILPCRQRVEAGVSKTDTTAVCRGTHLNRALEVADSDELEDALLDVLEPKVVLVQHGDGVAQVQVFLCRAEDEARHTQR